MARPIIGITVDNKGNTADSGTYESAIRYSQAVTAAGGLAILLPHEVKHVAQYVNLCHGLILTGGADPVMEQFGCATDGRARRIDQNRQAFELALLSEVDRQRDAAMGDTGDTPVLGVCLGMQLMALHNGASLDQYMPDTIGDEATAGHQDNARHSLIFEADDSVIQTDNTGGSINASATVVSSHRQRIADAGRLRIVARAEDGTIEAIDDPARRFYLGVQWHPERGGDDDCPMLNQGVLKALIDSSR